MFVPTHARQEYNVKRLGKLTEWGQARLIRLATTGRTPCTVCLHVNGMVLPAGPDGLCRMHRAQRNTLWSATAGQGATTHAHNL